MRRANTAVDLGTGAVGGHQVAAKGDDRERPEPLIGRRIALDASLSPVRVRRLAADRRRHIGILRAEAVRCRYRE